MTLANPPHLFRLEPTDPRPPFDCGDSDLNEFFAIDSMAYGKQLLSVTYVLKIEQTIGAFFSVSNDSIKTKDISSRSKKDRLLKPIPRPKRHPSMPAVKVGRLAVSEEIKGTGIGTSILDFIKVWFTQGNKTGCRFIIVDAYIHAVNFYEKNGFKFLVASDSDEKTRLMYFDLITFLK